MLNTICCADTSKLLLMSSSRYSTFLPASRSICRRWCAQLSVWLHELHAVVKLRQQHPGAIVQQEEESQGQQVAQHLELLQKADTELMTKAASKQILQASLQHHALAGRGRTPSSASQLHIRESQRPVQISEYRFFALLYI